MILSDNQIERTEKFLIEKNSNVLIGKDFKDKTSDNGTDLTFKHKIEWKNVIIFGGYHLTGLIGLFLVITFQIKFLTVIHSYDSPLLLLNLSFAIAFVIFLLAQLGITMGAHRYFTHRAFKATPTLQLILVIFFTMSGQNSLWEWVKDHRQHHRYSDTDADPHNARRGFFFSHLGWRMTQKHPNVIDYGKRINMADMEANYWVMLQKKYYRQAYVLGAMLIPCIIPVVLWNEDPLKSFLVCYSARTCLSLNFTCFVNSLAHTYGTKPYDRTILPGQNKLLSFFVIGEGWHNYHHAFPWDYRTAELGTPFNFTANVIDFCHKMGWVYEPKAATEESVVNRIKKTGDNSHEKAKSLR